MAGGPDEEEEDWRTESGDSSDGEQQQVDEVGMVTFWPFDDLWPLLMFWTLVNFWPFWHLDLLGLLTFSYLLAIGQLQWPLTFVDVWP